MGKLVVLAQFEVRPVHRARILEAARDQAEAVGRLESGCERFDVLADREDEGRGVLYEVYVDETAFETHRQMPHFAAFFDAINDLDVRWQSSRLTIPD